MATRIESNYSAGLEDDPFTIPLRDRSYKQQYANLYWLRLTKLRQSLSKRAKTRWGSLETPPHVVKRVLDLPPLKLAIIVGTVYMDMSLKPNILQDLAREHYLAAPPPRRKFCDPTDEIMLEDESGRVRLIGDLVQRGMGQFVTGTIMAVLGIENKAGDFQVLDLCFAGLPPQPPLTPLPNPTKSLVASRALAFSRAGADAADLNAMETDSLQGNSKSNGAADSEGEWIALLSGLEMGGSSQAADLRIQLLTEWLVGELGGENDVRESLNITRVILVGNSLLQPDVKDDEVKKPKRYGYDASLHSSLPTTTLDSFLTKLLPTLAVELLPGESDPTGPTMPQQALHEALLPGAAQWSDKSIDVADATAKKASTSTAKSMMPPKSIGAGWSRRTNPFWGRCGDSSILATSGQTLDDIFKYLVSEDRLGMAELTLEWAHVAPTCPDTLWCYPFATHDPFILSTLPHIYIIGNQPSFETTLVTAASHALNEESLTIPGVVSSSSALSAESSGAKSKTASKSKPLFATDSDDEMQIDDTATAVDDSESTKRCRIILLEKFSKSGKLVLVNSVTLEVKLVNFDMDL